MFDLSIHSYDEVKNFLEENIRNVNMEPCVEYEHNFTSNDDLYELIIVNISYEYYDDPHKNFNVCDVKFEKCYYYILKYNDESFFNELSVIDCGGYYIAICIFKNKINITNQMIHTKIKNKHCDCDCFTKFHMNTLIGNKLETIPKLY
jgi:hypothetical protein